MPGRSFAGVPASLEQARSVFGGAFIDSNGLLDDKIINISLGDLAAPPLDHGATLEACPTTSFEALASALSETITSMNTVVGDVRSIVGELDQSRTQDDVKRITSSLAAISEAPR